MTITNTADNNLATYILVSPFTTPGPGLGSVSNKVTFSPKAKAQYRIDVTMHYFDKAMKKTNLKDSRTWTPIP